MLKTDIRHHSDLPVPPGEYLAEVIQALSMSQADLARRMGRPAQAINEIIKGQKAITSETALQLEGVVGVPASVWLNLEAEYQLVRAKQEEERQLAAEVEILEQIPYREMARWGWVPKVKAAVDRVRELRRFFAVASLHNIPDVKAYAPAFRRAKDSAPYAVAAWLRQGEVEAEKLVAEQVVAKTFDPEALRGCLEEFRRATLLDPSEFVPLLEALFARYGVAFVPLPHLPGTYANGATFWTASGTPVLLISLRGKWADIFWFTLFHELGHLILHGRREVFVEGTPELDPARSLPEQEANQFARDSLIPPEDYYYLLRKGDFSERGVRSFAATIGIHPGIVVGRLHHDQLLDRRRLNNLRPRYEWKVSEA